MLDTPLREGLARAGKLTSGTGYLDLTAGIAGNRLNFAGFVRGEGGYRVGPVSAFAFSEATLAATGPAFMAGVGLRATF